MKSLLFFLLMICILNTGCEKTVDSIKEDLVVKAMTDGKWGVTSFTENGVVVTSSFSTFQFKYYSNKTVDAINNGTVQQTGTWDGDAASMTTSANFLSASHPLSLINGTWHITNNGWTYVVATQTGPSGTKTMRLDKL